MVPELKALGAAVASDPALSSRVVIGKVCIEVLVDTRLQRGRQQVDADKHRELGTRFGVSGFPTIKWFTRGEKVSEPSEYVVELGCARGCALWLLHSLVCYVHHNA